MACAVGLLLTGSPGRVASFNLHVSSIIENKIIAPHFFLQVGITSLKANQKVYLSSFMEVLCRNYSYDLLIMFFLSTVAAFFRQCNKSAFGSTKLLLQVALLKLKRK